MKELVYFNGWELKFRKMIEILETDPNINVDYISLGEGLSDIAIERIEDSLGRKLPLAVKEFYQLFGHVKLLWHFKKPFIKGKETYVDTDYYCLHSGQHQGSIHIMPLEKVLFIDWKKEQHNIPENLNLKIFDYYSLYHMLAFELNEDSDPIVYLGEDHGADFSNIKYTFSSYLKMITGIYGYINRFKHLQFWTLNEKDSIFNEKNWNLAIKDFVSIDFSNRNEIEKYIERKWEQIHTAMKNADYDTAYEIASDNLWEYDAKANAIVLDVLTIREDEAGYFEWLGYAIQDQFDLSEYETSTKYTKFINTEKYKTLKNTK